MDESTPTGQEEQVHEGPLFSYDLKIPQERVAVLVGTKGATKKRIEQECHADLDITTEGEVVITGSDALKLYTCRDIVRAIARGFNPDLAFLLLKPDYGFELIRLRDLAGKNQKQMERLKGRVIGRSGRSRGVIEELTGASISVYGKTIGIIGDADALGLAHHAVEMLLKGAMHKTVFKFLEKKRQEMRFGKDDVNML